MAASAETEPGVSQAQSHHIHPHPGAIAIAESEFDGLPPSPEDDDDQQVPFVISKWCGQCWPKRRSLCSDPDHECAKNCDNEKRNADTVVTILWPPIPVEGQPQTNVVVRPPPPNFDFSHMQYLPCGYGRQCKHGLTCTRAHSSPPQAEIAYWNFVQPLGAPSRRRRAATQKNMGKDWSLTTLYECKVCAVRMNSPAQLAQHQTGSKHRTQMAAANLTSTAGPAPTIAMPPVGPSAGVLPHGTGPYYQGISTEWSGGSPHGGPGTAGLNDPGAANHETPLAGIDGTASFTKDDPMTRANWATSQAYITAVKAGDNVEITRLLLEGVDVDTRDSGCPALHWAIFMGRVETVSLLVKSGARKDLQDRDKQTAVHICVHPRHGMMNQMRKESKVLKVPLKYEEDAVRVLTTLLQAGWSPDLRDALGRTGLHHVAEQGNCTLAYVLLQFKANPALHNTDGYSPTDVATLKAKSEGLTKYVQLRDLLRTALFDVQEAGAGTNPMAIPGSGGESMGSSNIGRVGARNGAPPAGVIGGGSSSAGMPVGGGRGMAPAMLPPIGAPTAQSYDVSSHSDDDVDDSFRPLLAALASLSSRHDVTAEKGVEMSQLEVRLREVLIFTGVNFTSYLQHAQKAGLVTIRQAANGQRHYVSIARRFASLVVRPSVLSESSSTMFGSTSVGSMIPASQSLQWHRGHAGSNGQQPTMSQSNLKVATALSEVAETDNVPTSPLDYEALISGVLDHDGDGSDWASRQSGDTSDLNKITHSFMFDPFASATHLGPEPLFADSVPLSAEDSAQRSRSMSEAHGPAPGSPWRGSPKRPQQENLEPSLRPNPVGGILSSFSFADMSMLQSSGLGVHGASAGSNRSPWPDQRGGTGCQRADSLPSFGTSTPPPGLSPRLSRAGGRMPSSPWQSDAKASPSSGWAGSGFGTPELSSSIEWLNIASKTEKK